MSLASFVRAFAPTIYLIAMANVSVSQDPIELQCKELTESSGVASSTYDPQIIWTHNDSGDKPRLFAFTRDGKWIAEVELARTQAVDWEDMCSFRRGDRHYLAVGDVGDNQRKRKSVFVYVIEEPKLDKDVAAPVNKLVDQVQRIEVQYASGPADCESLAYDATTDTFLLATKEFLRCRLGTFDANPTSDGRPVQLTFGQTLGLPLTTAADISSDGQRLVIATYGPASIFRRAADGRWDASEATLQTRTLPARKQGESICFADLDKTLLLTSEFAPAPLWSIPVESPAANQDE